MILIRNAQRNQQWQRKFFQEDSKKEKFFQTKGKNRSWQIDDQQAWDKQNSIYDKNDGLNDPENV